MSLPAAYLAVVLIWSTTPLGIQWSTQGVNYALAVLLRMLIGAVLTALILGLWRIPLPLHARARRAYLVGGIGLFGAMALTYWGARHIHSGLISVLFGLSPLIAGLLAALFLGEKALTPPKLAGTLLGGLGLAVIFLHGGHSTGGQSLLGLLALLAAVFVYSGSLVWLKRIGDDSPPLATTLGTLSVSLPLFLALWWLDGAALPGAAPSRALAAIVYLGVFGSVLGFALYYWLIRHLEASKVALITLITPVLALLLGHAFNGEAVAARVWLGSATILLGLALHQGETLADLLRQWGKATRR